jgi:hypothetical protein
MESCCKVGRVINEYALADEVPFDTVDEYLARRWNGDGMEAVGVRKLADWINRSILKIEYDSVGLSTLESRVKSDYETLQSDNEMQRNSLEIELREAGVPVSDVEDAFVSGPTVYRHLTNCMGSEKVTEESSEWERDRIEYHLEQLEDGVKAAFRSLRNKDEISFSGDLEVSVSVYVSDEGGESEVGVERALRRGYISDSNRE